MRTISEENKDLIRRFWDAMNTRRLDVLDDLLVPDVVRHCQATPQLNVRSCDQVKEFLRQDSGVFPDSIQTITHLVAEGDKPGRPKKDEALPGFEWVGPTSCG
jgi:ketosteroid isomerase-like protein